MTRLPHHDDIDERADEAALHAAIAAIVPSADPVLAARLQARLDDLTKPPGSLGRLEALALQLGLVQRSERPRLDAPALLLFAADHGIATGGVSAYPRAVTAQMVANIVGGGAAISVLCRQHGIALTVTDVGVLPAAPSAGLPAPQPAMLPAMPPDARLDAAGGAAASPGRPRLVRAPVAAGTADMRMAAAMTRGQCLRAITSGRQRVAEACGATDIAASADAILLGEMGIGNTSSAALLTAWACDAPIEACTGRGTAHDGRRSPGAAWPVAVAAAS